MPNTAHKIIQNILEPHQNLLSTLQNSGATVYLVGGAVRDALLGIIPTDLDMEIHDMVPDLLEKILMKFGPVNFVGKNFGIYHTPTIEFSLPRNDEKIAAGHKGFATIVDLSLSFQAATVRRDLTINALGYNIHTNEILDYHHGVEDLKAGILRAVSPKTFIEDPLRGLRVAQFAARFGMRPDAELVKLSATLDLSELPPERIQIELEKLLLKGQKPSLGFEFLKDAALLKFLPFQNIDTAETWNLLMQSLDQGALMPKGLWSEKLSMMLAIIGYTTHQPHYKAALAALRFPKHIAGPAQGMIQALTKLPQLFTPLAQREDFCLFRRTLWKQGVSLEAVLFLTDIVMKHQNLTAAYRMATKHYGVNLETIKDVVQGRHLLDHGYAPGPDFKQHLESCRKIQYETDLKTTAEIIQVMKNK